MALLFWIFIWLLVPQPTEASATYDLAGKNLTFSGPWGYYGGLNHGEYGEVQATLKITDSSSRNYSSKEDIITFFNSSEYVVRFIGANGILTELNNSNSTWNLITYGEESSTSGLLSVNQDHLNLNLYASDPNSSIGLTLQGPGIAQFTAGYNYTWKGFYYSAVNQASEFKTNSSNFTFISMPTDNYTNSLGDDQSVSENFNDYSETASNLLGYDSGAFSVTNNRLEFTTTSKWIGIKTLKETMNLGQSWSTKVDFKLNNLSGLFEGNYYNVGLAISFGQNFNDAFPNRIVLKASQDLSRRTLGLKVYKDNLYISGSEDNENLAGFFSEGVLTIEYDSDSKLFSGFFRPKTSENQIFLGDFDLNSASEINPSSNNVVSISIFAGSQPFSEPEGFATINSGDIYLRNYSYKRLSSASEFSYSVENGNAILTGYLGTNSTISVPIKIDGHTITKVGNEAFRDNLLIQDVTFQEGLTSIGENAFFGCTNLRSATLPNTVTNIGGGVFAYCAKLKKANLPVSLTNLPQYVFYHCYSLTNIELPSNLQRIGSYNFANCYNLKSINIPSQVSVIADSSFINCISLTNLSVDSNNAHFSSNDGVILNKEASVLKIFPSGRTSAYTIPNSVTNISTNAFITSKLTSLVIPSSVTSISDGAFAWCKDLSNIQFNHGLLTLGDNTFYECVNLASVRLPASVTAIGNWAFTGCSNLAIVSLPLKLVGNYQSYNISDSVEFSKPIAEIALEKNLIAQENFADGQKTITDSPNAFGFYTTNQIHNLGLSGIVLDRDTNDNLVLNYQVLQSSDLQTWTPYQSVTLPITNAPSDKMFLRVQAVGP